MAQQPPPPEPFPITLAQSQDDVVLEGVDQVVHERDEGVPVLEGLHDSQVRGLDSLEDGSSAWVDIGRVEGRFVQVHECETALTPLVLFPR